MKAKKIIQHADKAWDCPAVIVASGPSLGWDDFADVKLLESVNIKTVAVNNTFERLPWCDLLYAGDGIWWKYHHKEALKLKCDMWACSKNPSILYGVRYRPRHIKPGYNSGANAIELVANVYNANPILLLGFDCSVKHGVHHHKDHKNTRNPDADRCRRWKEQFKSVRGKTKKTTIINCSRYTEIPFFERADLRQTLCELNLMPG